MVGQDVFLLSTFPHLPVSYPSSFLVRHILNRQPLRCDSRPASQSWQRSCPGLKPFPYSSVPSHSCFFLPCVFSIFHRTRHHGSFHFPHPPCSQAFSFPCPSMSFIPKNGLPEPTSSSPARHIHGPFVLPPSWSSFPCTSPSLGRGRGGILVWVPICSPQVPRARQWSPFIVPFPPSFRPSFLKTTSGYPPLPVRLPVQASQKKNFQSQWQNFHPYQLLYSLLFSNVIRQLLFIILYFFILCFPYSPVSPSSSFPSS